MKITITSKTEELDHTMLSWCKKHCKSYITNTGYIKDLEVYYEYYFSDEKDAVMFLLKWK